MKPVDGGRRAERLAGAGGRQDGTARTWPADRQAVPAGFAQGLSLECWSARRLAAAVMKAA